MRAHTFEPPRRAGLRSGFLTTKLPSAEIDHSPRTAPALAAAARHARQEGKHPAVEADSPAKKLPSSSSVIAAEAYQLPIAPPWASQMETPPQPTSAQPTLAQPPPQSRIFEMPNLCDARTLKVADEHESGQKNCVVGIGSAACALLLSSPPIVEACPMPISVAALDNDDDISLCKRVDQILNTAKADWSLASNFEERWPTWHRAALCLWGLSSTEKTELLRAVEELEDVDHDPTRERFRYAFPAFEAALGPNVRDIEDLSKVQQMLLLPRKEPPSLEPLDLQRTILREFLMINAEATTADSSGFDESMKATISMLEDASNMAFKGISLADCREGMRAMLAAAEGSGIKALVYVDLKPPCDHAALKCIRWELLGCPMHEPCCVWPSALSSSTGEQPRAELKLACAADRSKQCAHARSLLEAAKTAAEQCRTLGRDGCAAEIHRLSQQLPIPCKPPLKPTHSISMYAQPNQQAEAAVSGTALRFTLQEGGGMIQLRHASSNIVQQASPQPAAQEPTQSPQLPLRTAAQQPAAQEPTQSFQLPLRAAAPQPAAQRPKHRARRPTRAPRPPSITKNVPAETNAMLLSITSPGNVVDDYLMADIDLQTDAELEELVSSSISAGFGPCSMEEMEEACRAAPPTALLDRRSPIIPRGADDTLELPTEHVIQSAVQLKYDDEQDDKSAEATAEVVSEAEGIELHLSRYSATGYKGVHRRPSGRFHACFSSGRGKGGLGSFPTAVEAAVAYAIYTANSLDNKAEFEVEAETEATVVSAELPEAVDTAAACSELQEAADGEGALVHNTMQVPEAVTQVEAAEPETDEGDALLASLLPESNAISNVDEAPEGLLPLVDEFMTLMNVSEMAERSIATHLQPSSRGTACSATLDTPQALLVPLFQPPEPICGGHPTPVFSPRAMRARPKADSSMLLRSPQQPIPEAVDEEIAEAAVAAAAEAALATAEQGLASSLKCGAGARLVPLSSQRRSGRRLRDLESEYDASGGATSPIADSMRETKAARFERCSVRVKLAGLESYGRLALAVSASLAVFEINEDSTTEPEPASPTSTPAATLRGGVLAKPVVLKPIGSQPPGSVHCAKPEVRSPRALEELKESQTLTHTKETEALTNSKLEDGRRLLRSSMPPPQKQEREAPTTATATAMATVTATATATMMIPVMAPKLIEENENGALAPFQAQPQDGKCLLRSATLAPSMPLAPQQALEPAPDHARKMSVTARVRRRKQDLAFDYNGDIDDDAKIKRHNFQRTPELQVPPRLPPDLLSAVAKQAAKRLAKQAAMEEEENDECSFFELLTRSMSVDDVSIEEPELTVASPAFTPTVLPKLRSVLSRSSSIGTQRAGSAASGRLSSNTGRASSRGVVRSASTLSPAFGGTVSTLSGAFGHPSYGAADKPRSWSAEEDQALIEAVEAGGGERPCWLRISGSVGNGRNPAMCRNRFDRMVSNLKNIRKLARKWKCRSCGTRSEWGCCEYSAAMASKLPQLQETCKLEQPAELQETVDGEGALVHNTIQVQEALSSGDAQMPPPPSFEVEDEKDDDR